MQSVLGAPFLNMTFSLALFVAMAASVAAVFGTVTLPLTST